MTEDAYRELERLSPDRKQAFWWAVGFTGVALVLGLMLPSRTPRPLPIATE